MENVLPLQRTHCDLVLLVLPGVGIVQSTTQPTCLVHHAWCHCFFFKFKLANSFTYNPFFSPNPPPFIFHARMMNTSVAPIHD